MRAPALALLALLGSLAPGTAAGGGLAGDLDASAGYAVGGAGALLPLAGLPAVPGQAAPATGAALDPAPLSAEQGRALRPADGVAWGSDLALGLDAQQRVAAEDTQAFADAWGAWAQVHPPPAGSLVALARPGRVAAEAVAGPRIHSLATHPAWHELTNVDPALRVVAALDAPRGVHRAWATLRIGDRAVERDLHQGPDGLWSTTFAGPFPAGQPLEMRLEALDGAARAAAASGFAEGAWPLGYSRTDALPLLARDAVAPTLRLHLPAYTNASVAVALVEARDDVALDALRFDAGGGFGPWGLPAPSLPIALAADGPATVRAEVRDRAGNAALAEATVVRDTEAPLVELEAPGGAAWLPAPTTLRLRPGPSLAPASVHATLDGRDPRAAPALASESVTIAAPGSTVVRAVARDAAGNIGPEERLEVRIDPAAPVLSLRSAVPLDAWLASPPRLAVEAHDALSGVAAVEAVLVDASGVRRAVEPAGFQPAEGVHRLLARAWDRAGHAAALEQPLRVDLTPPLSRLAAAGAGAYELAWRAVDAGSGVARVRVEARAPGQPWATLAEGGAEGALALAVPSGEVREVRVLARDAVGHVEAKAAPDLVLHGPEPAPAPAPAAAPPEPADTPPPSPAPEPLPVTSAPPPPPAPAPPPEPVPPAPAAPGAPPPAATKAVPAAAFPAALALAALLRRRRP